MKLNGIASGAAVLAATQIVLAAGADAQAGQQPQHDQNVTPNVIFGSGVVNGSFTTRTENGIEVGLRGKVRFPSPENTFNSNGDGTYSFPKGDACPGFGFAPEPLCLATPLWSFEWSVNTDVLGMSGNTVGDFVYELGLDADPSKKTDFTVFDNITPSLVAPYFDHAFGMNGTIEGDGVVADDPATYVSHLETYNVVQNSWNYEFFNTLGTSLASFDPSVDGNYVIYLKVKNPDGEGDDESNTVAQVQIEILVGAGEPLEGNKQF